MITNYRFLKADCYVSGCSFYRRSSWFGGGQHLRRNGQFVVDAAELLDNGLGGFGAFARGPRPDATVADMSAGGGDGLAEIGKQVATADGAATEVGHADPRRRRT